MPFPATTYDSATFVNPTGALTDFPAPIKLSRMSAAWWAAVNTTDGTRGRAFLEDGTELACVWIAFDPVAKTGWLRVKIPSWATSGSKVVRVYPPNTINAAVAAGDTYGSDNALPPHCKSFWPLTADLNDLTAHGNHGTAIGGVAAGGGTAPDGSAATTFDGSDDYIQVNNPVASTLVPLTVIGWANTHASPQRGDIFSMSNGGTSLYRRLAVNETTTSDDNAAADARYTGGATKASSGDVNINSGWHQVVGIWANGDLSVAVDDGSLVTASGVAPISEAFSRAAIGALWRSTPALYFKGDLWMVQAHDIAPSAAWIKHEFEMVSDQDAMVGAWTNTPLASAGRRRAMVIS